ncbi:type II toxin-antitoxin system MqsA family antitoxin [Denitrificimonas caeni]|uniref:Type II toxin-antitoxin system MqsA family antitoxin n=1 Tax=Denitrificimonas caeni TaxID=521720 RepID=A0AAE9VMV0_9GAMM|nr:type II toxin-antitoxin system MqsA family antitoxin [Denitrificimonas caeni]WBE25056.1 type II toxin-antitoxin system MqsA family antitoxin [Denitrificimonas caeni]
MTTDKKVSPICPLCEQGVLTEQETSELTVYKGVERMLPLHFACCSECGTEQAEAKHIRANKRAMQAFKKEVDGLLTGVQMRELRESLGLTQGQAAEVFGGGPVAFSKYESDDVAQSEGMDKLLRVAQAVPAAFAWLKQHAGFAADQAALSKESMVLPLAAVGVKRCAQPQKFADFQLQTPMREQLVIGTAYFTGAAQSQWVH